MLTLLLGRSGSGKSMAILERMKRNGIERPQILIVPEQASYESERLLCEANGNTASAYAEVFSFRSLEERVESVAGGRARTFLDDGGRLLVMYAALKSVSENLSVLGIPSRKPEFLTGLLTTVDEMKSYCISPEMLGEIAEELDGLSGQKMQDLALIYGMYHAMTEDGALDPRDKLTRLSEKLKEYPFAKGKDIYLDGFIDFTPQEEQVLEELIRQGESLTIALTTSDLQKKNKPSDLFSAAKQTGHLALSLAKKNHVPYEVVELPVRKDLRSSPLAHLEQQLFSGETVPYEKEQKEAISVYEASSLREEVSWTAGKIRELLQGGHIKCRDIAVTARNIEPYEELVDSIFAQYDIPVFQSSMESILQKPMFTLVVAAIDIVAGNFSYEDVFRYLKTGLSNLTLEECDILENYVLLWDIKGSQWTAKSDFTQHPRGYQENFEEKDIEQLEQLNKIRCKVIKPFEDIRSKHHKTFKDKVVSLYSFLEAIQLPENLELRSEELLLRGDPELALEYQQLWGILCEALEQCVQLLGDQPVEQDEFSRLLRLLFSQYSVGSIPIALDRVVFGEMGRLSNRRAKVLFLLGADDSMIPSFSFPKGLLTEQDREILSDYGLPLTWEMEEQMSREMTMVYSACAQPTQALFVTWPKMSDSGEERRLSFLIDTLHNIFPEGLTPSSGGKTIANQPMLLELLGVQDPFVFGRLVAEDPDRLELLKRLEEASAWTRGKLSSDMVTKLYGKQMALSASRLDQYQSCHFSFFMKYGLKAKQRKPAGFYAPEYGSFIHFVLEFVLKEGKKQGHLSQLSQEQVEQLTKQAIQAYIREMFSDLQEQTTRFRYLFLRLERTVLLVVQNVVEELRQSDFQPLFFELGFGQGETLPPIEISEDGMSLRLSGFVDRVDGWVKDGRLYVKVVDYKTGRKSFDLTEIWHGLGLQMLVYLFALELHGPSLGASDVVPAGALYLPARDIFVSGNRSIDEETRQRMVDKELVRKGILLDDPTVIEAMEVPAKSGPRFLPVRVSVKSGTITGDSLVNTEQLGRLKLHTEQILKGICKEIGKGEIKAEPFWRGPSRNACLYCEYASVCHFEDGLGGEQRRWIPSLSNSEFWAHFEAEGGEEHVEKDEGSGSGCS